MKYRNLKVKILTIGLLKREKAKFTNITHNWIIPIPSQSPREPPISENSFEKDILGKRDSVTVTTWSKVTSSPDNP